MSRAEIDRPAPGMKINCVALPYFSKKPASLATHNGAVLPLSLAVLKFMGAAEIEIGAPMSIHRNIRTAMSLIIATLPTCSIDPLKFYLDCSWSERLKLSFNLFLKTEHLTILSSEPIDHLRMLLFHVDDLFPLCIFVGWCPGDEG